MVQVNGQVFCKPCVEVPGRRAARDTSGSARFVLSIFPGVGHLYMGLFQRGFQMLIAFIGGCIILGNLFDPLLGFFVPAMIFFSIFDAREAYIRMSQGLEVEDKGFVDLKTLKLDWNSRWIGYVLVGLGALALFNVLLNDVLRIAFPDYEQYAMVVRAIRGSVVGLLAIGAGLWMLRRNNVGSSRE